jgi:hypothetical protein
MTLHRSASPALSPDYSRTVCIRSKGPTPALLPSLAVTPYIKVKPWRGGGLEPTFSTEQFKNEGLELTLSNQMMG